MSRLILMRHGESIYNKKNLFTGWTDVELSEKGVQEAKEAGALLKKNGIYPDICFTSWLKRAIHTAQIVLRELEWEHIDAIRSYKLNERHYGAWQGQNKTKVLEAYGEEQFLAVRRGYDVPPPPLNENDMRVVWRDKKYAGIAHELLPLHESLKETKKRVLEYYDAVLSKELQAEKTVLVSTHGNSLRALVMHLEKMSKEDVVKLEIPTGEIIVYSFDKSLQLSKKEVLLG
ncbi:MAG TPA: 2,3-diphosphoglycerate-dependent phosphoglycerate mutase [Sulfurimonas autotrophica]|uniref:2,3-bisphosphoglycerate-dependent phosphoglycerate mutase n=1 Tax=Sulfurimonas autotrophica TaxID=202747 RepID=A0A7C3GA06_9BACT|nr:2,3-diphosphoglycerate-dependent phosphoglycerate mutase [Sulfurimonas autotrophica]